MTPFQKLIFSSKEKTNNIKDIWIFPDNDSTIKSFTIGTKLNKIIINWGDGASVLSNNYEPQNHTF